MVIKIGPLLNDLNDKEIILLKATMATNAGTSSSLEDMSMYLKKHDSALEALKDVPTILDKLAKKVGIEINTVEEEPNRRSTWSLGLSDDEESGDTENVVNKIMGNDDGKCYYVSIYILT